MSALSPDAALFSVWAGFLLLGVVTGSAVLLWGIRSGQFGDQERARHLPLLHDAEEPQETQQPGKRVP